MNPARPILSIPEELIPSLKKRMAKKIATSPSGCMEWAGSKTADGYGVVSITLAGRVRMLAAHRASWMVHKGPIEPGMVLDHLCRVRQCVNIEHLEPVTTTVNNDRGIASRRMLPPIAKRPAWITPDLWAKAQAKAEQEGTKASEVVRQMLTLYVETEHVKPSDPVTTAGYAHIATCPQCHERFS